MSVAANVVGEPGFGASLPPAPTGAARLADGGSVVAWRSQSQLTAQVLDASGTPRGAPISLPSAPITRFALTALAGGDWVLVWSELADAGSQLPATINYRLYGADGQVKQGTTAVTTTSWSAVYDLSATATADGGFAVAWVATPQPVAPEMVYVARFGAGGAVQVSPAFPYSGAERVHIVGLPDNTTVHATSTFIDGPGSHWSVVFHHLDASGQEIGTPHPVVDAPSGSRLDFDIAATTDGRIGVAWRYPDEFGASQVVMTQLLDASGAPVSPTVTSSPEQVDKLTSGPLANGSFGVYVQAFIGFNRGMLQRLSAIVVDAAGAQGTSTLVTQAGVSSVSPTTGTTTGPATLGFAVATGPDGHAVISYERDMGRDVEVFAEGH